MVVRCIAICLAANEWGSELMSGIAASHFDTLPPDTDEVVHIIEVNEHAGWRLAYARIGGKVEVVGSANDMAVYPSHVREFFNRIKGASWDYAPYIRR